MRIKQRALGPSIVYVALAAAVCVLLSAATAGATIQYLNDGAVHDGNGWKVPQQGTCPPFEANGYMPMGAYTTRAECLAIRIEPNTGPGACAQNSDCSTNYCTTGLTRVVGVCNDDASTTQEDCEAGPDRLWNPSTGICSIVMLDDDRNNVACALHGGTWVTSGVCTGLWQNGARDAYDPPLLTGNGPGDQCLRCHNQFTQYNSPRVRDTEDTLYMGHKNMARKVVPGQAWGGPPLGCFLFGIRNPYIIGEEDCELIGGLWQPVNPYPTDDGGNAMDWENGTINIGGNDREMLWVYGDWLGPLPRVVAKLPGSSSNVCDDPRYSTANCVGNGGNLIPNAGVSYSCGRCHMTGWTSDATVNSGVGIEGKEPEASFPGITFLRTVGADNNEKVNLSGNVTGDLNKYSSWDAWGITCTRCHNSAIDTTKGGTQTPPQYGSPTGMSSHHSNLTGATGDQCTDPRWTAEAQCTAAGGTWIAATGTASCSVAGVCNTLNPADSDEATCIASGGQWAAATDVIGCVDIHEYGKEHGIPEYEAARFTGTATNRGQIITALCMNCHRQETGGLPYGATSVDGVNVDYSGTDPGQQLKVGPAHGELAFVSHPHGNMFLNSPHGQFTGTFDQIATGVRPTEYGSYFLNLGEAANTGNGCTGCHDVHQSTVPGVGAEPIHEECTECHHKDLRAMRHPMTPFKNTKSDPAAPCVKCHMPGGLHLFRVNADADYSTFPAAALTSTVNANTSPDGDYANAVWVDVDLACGQCHGGGEKYAHSSVVSVAGAAVTVADPTDFVVGGRVVIEGGGALEEDGITRGEFESYVKSIAADVLTLMGGPSGDVTGATVEQNPNVGIAPYFNKEILGALADGIHGDGATANFTYSFPDPDNKLLIALDASSTLPGSYCGHLACSITRYDWDFGDGETCDDCTATETHEYASGGGKRVKLTVTNTADADSSVTKTVLTFGPSADRPPTVGGNDVDDCASIIVDANAWGAQIADDSDDDNPPLKQVTVNWGDGTLMDIGPAGSTFNHTYKKLPTLGCLDAATQKKIVTATDADACTDAGGVWDRYFYVTHIAIDSIGQMSTKNCAIQLSTFTVSGTVYDNTATPVSGAALMLKKGTLILKATTSAPTTGEFSFTGVKPGDYTIEVTKAGLTFDVPAYPPPPTPPDPQEVITAGPDNTGISISAQ